MNFKLYRARLSRLRDLFKIELYGRNGKIKKGNRSFFYIWNSLNGLKKEELISKISIEYDVTRDEIEEDIDHIISKLEENDMIKQNPPSIHIYKGKLTLNCCHFTITSRCNLKCTHCYQTKTKSQDMELFKVKRILDNLSKNGILSVEISGGEPLLHKDIFQILEYSKDLGFYIKLFTNGTLINEENAGFLLENVNEFRISLDGKREFHNRRRGNRAFEKAIKGLKILGDSQIQISQTIDYQEETDISFIKEFAFKHNYKVGISPVVPYSHLKRNNEYLFRAVRLILKNYDQNETDRLVKGPNCGAGDKLIYIDNIGETYPCPLLSNNNFILGNAYQSDITNIISNKNPRYRSFLSLKNSLLNCIKCNKCYYWCMALFLNTRNNENSKFLFCIQ